MARHVVEADSVVVEVVQDCETALVTFPVVRLGSVGSSSVRPQASRCGSSRRPGDGWVSAMVNISTSPKVLLVLPCHQTCELPLFSGGIKADRPHALASAEGSSLSRGEGGAA